MCSNVVNLFSQSLSTMIGVLRVTDTAHISNVGIRISIRKQFSDSRKHIFFVLTNLVQVCANNNHRTPRSICLKMIISIFNKSSNIILYIP